MCKQIATDLIGEEVQFFRHTYDDHNTLKPVGGTVRAAYVNGDGKLVWLIQESDGFIHRYSDDEISGAYFCENVRNMAFPDSNAVHL